MSARRTIMNDLYQTLEVNPDATAEQIRAAFKRLALKYHPDKNPEADSRAFMNIQIAYNILKDPESRQKYDDTIQTIEKQDNTLLHDWMCVFMDIMRAQLCATKRNIRGRDVILKIPVQLHELYNGDVKKVATRVKRNGEWITKAFYVNLVQGKSSYVFPREGDDNMGDVIIQIDVICPSCIRLEGHDVILEHEIDLYTFMYGGIIDIKYIDENVLHVDVHPFTLNMKVEEEGVPYITNNRDICYGDLCIKFVVKVDLVVLHNHTVHDFIKMYFKKQYVPRGSGETVREYRQGVQGTPCMVQDK